MDPSKLCIHLHDMIFGSSTYLPLGKVRVKVNGDSKCQTSITYDTYILDDEEAKRQHYSSRELYYNCWFYTNINCSDNAELLTRPTHARVADIYYMDKAGINPDYAARLRHSEVYHYRCLPGPHHGKIDYDMSNMLFASMVPPGTVLFPNGTEMPVIVRYLSVLSIQDGKASSYADLYLEDPRRNAIREIHERLMWYTPQIRSVANARVTKPIQEVREHLLDDMQIDGDTYRIPVKWEDTPTHQHYSVIEPDWVAWNNNKPIACRADLEHLVRVCTCKSPGFKVVEYQFLGNDIDGIPVIDTKMYCFLHNSIWYGIGDGQITLYTKYYVPINTELASALSESLIKLNNM